MKFDFKSLFLKPFTVVFIVTLLVSAIIFLEFYSGINNSCKISDNWKVIVGCFVEESVFLNALKSLSILSAVVLYFVEAPTRKKQSHYDAWRTIDLAQGIANSYARFQAIEDLNNDKVPLKRLEVPKADLEGINLRKAKLIQANLSGASLKKANLIEANIWDANLVNTDFTGAKLHQADLKGCKLENAKFILAELDKADLRNLEFIGVDLRNAQLNGADLEGADLTGAKSLKLKQLQSAKNWQKAKYNENLLNE